MQDVTKIRAYVLGVGRMGSAIAYAMNKLGFEVMGMDTDPHAVYRLPKRDGLHFFPVENVDEIFATITSHSAQSGHPPDIVISSLPYHQTEEVGMWCVNSNLRYCDLGGRVDVSKNINDHAKQNATVPVFTDLGLAPGWVNILAEQGYKELHGPADDTHIEMMVGGLPDYLESANNPLRYAVTWSVDGLINEYKDDCLILENGKIKTVRGMDGLETVETDSLDKLEAFYTSGGASHSVYSMQARGVKDCSYKTLRYKGHRDIVKFLIRDCALDDDTLNKIFLEGCGTANKDEVIIVAKVTRGNRVWREEKLIKSDEQFSAMQKATAFSIASVAAIMADGKLEGNREQRRDYWIQYNKSLSYADVPFYEFNKNLSRLGLV